eukprot:UN19238
MILTFEYIILFIPGLLNCSELIQ